MSSNPEQDFVLKTIKGRDVHFVRFWFTDVLGNMKSFAVIPSELENAFEDGMGLRRQLRRGLLPHAGKRHARLPRRLDLPGASVAPRKQRRRSHVLRHPHARRQALRGRPRQVLAREVQRALDMGYVLNVGPELEFFYFKDQHSTEVLDHGGYFDLTSLDYASDLRRDTVLTLEKMGIPVEYSHHENGPSQHEIDLRFTDALSMADAVMTYKLVVKEIAMKHGVYASFMPKPLADAPGSGMHVHQSLFDLDGNNAFFDPNDPLGYNLSDLAKHYIAGLLKYAPEFCCITNQYVNSYKRLVSGGEAPTYISWGARNRSTLVRIPAYRPNREVACRVELRNPDPAANPYLAFACMLAAGLAGIEEELPLQDPTEGSRPLRAFASGPAQAGRSHAAREPRRGGRAFRGVRAHEKDARRAYPRLSGGDEARRMERIPGHRFRMGAQSLPRGPLDVRPACGKG